MARHVFVREGRSTQTALSRSNSDHFAESNSIFLTHSASINHTASSLRRPKLGVSRIDCASAASSSRLSQRSRETSVPPASAISKP